MPRGRKPKYTIESLPKDWKARVLDMMSEGCSQTEVTAAILNNSYSAWLRLQEQDKEFQRVVQFGKILAQAWWEKQARENLESRYFQTGLWSMNMKNRFGWTDRTTIEHEMGDHLYEKFRESNTEALKQRARELLRKYGTTRINADTSGVIISEASKSN